MQTTACLRKGDGYMDKSKTHILAFFTGHDAPEKKSVYVEMNGQGDELTRLVASVAIKMFSLGTTNKNIIQMRKQYLFDIINKAKENPGQAQGVMFKVPAGDMPMEEVVKRIISAVDKQARKDQNGG